MSIRTKLILAVLIVAFIGGCIGMVGYYSNRSTVSIYDMIAKESSPRLILLSKISEHANRMQVEAISYTLLEVLNLRFENESNRGLSRESGEELKEMEKASEALKHA